MGASIGARCTHTHPPGILPGKPQRCRENLSVGSSRRSGLQAPDVSRQLRQLQGFSQLTHIAECRAQQALGSTSLPASSKESNTAFHCWQRRLHIRRGFGKKLLLILSSSQRWTDVLHCPSCYPDTHLGHSSGKYRKKRKNLQVRDICRQVKQRVPEKKIFWPMSCCIPKQQGRRDNSHIIC